VGEGTRPDGYGEIVRAGPCARLAGMIRRRIASAAGIIMLGTLTTSVLGFVRAFVVARYFGAGTRTDAFFAALVVPQMFYDQLIGGAIAAVLIPSFSRLAVEDQRELWRVIGSVFALVAVVLTATVLILEVLAHPLMMVIASGFALHTHAGALPLSVKLLRVLLPALIFMGLAAVALATLYSLNRRVVPSFATAGYHIGIIVAAVVASTRWGITALAVGAVAGAALQLIVQIPSLLEARRRMHVPALKIRLDLQNAAVRRILWLYVPVAAGLCVSIAGQVADINFKSHLPQTGGLSSMQYATQVIQFPIGIVVGALGFAVLPSISADVAAGQLGRFKDALMVGFRLVLVLMIPAMAGILTLATPIVSLLFQRGQFTHVDTVHTATALLGYAPQLPFIGLDQLLIVAFYARHNTLTPALVGVAGVGIYVLSAAILLGRLTILGLALANTIQIGAHALILLVLLLRAVGALPLTKFPGTVGKVCLATGGMTAAILAVQHWLSPNGGGSYAHFVAVSLPIVIAVAVYGGLLLALRVEEATLLWKAIRVKVGGS